MGEEVEPGETASIQKVIDAAMGALSRDYKAPHVPRDAHAKSHVCLTASFEVDNKNLPPELRVGLFAENKSYPAWVRFSNNTSDPMSNDKDLDLRGIGVKVMNVEGTKIIPSEINETTQDFLMFASPIFFVKNIADYADFIKALGQGKAFQNLLGKPHSLIQLATAQLRASGKRNPLSLQYYSASPYRLGAIEDPNRRPVKYSFKPCDPSKKQPQGVRSHPNFMREALIESLKRDDACFEFQVQVGDPHHPTVYPVEDPSVQWPEDNGGYGINVSSPYQTVATLKISRQDFNTEARNQFCERLTLTPWHARREHRPLGRTNRMRRVLYESISAYRHAQNGIPSRTRQLRYRQGIS
jgi:catalase